MFHRKKTVPSINYMVVQAIEYGLWFMYLSYVYDSLLNKHYLLLKMNKE